MDRVLCFVASGSLDRAEVVRSGLKAAAASLGSHRTRIAVETSLARLAARIRAGGADVLVLDMADGGRGARASVRDALRTLFDEHDVAGTINRDRTWLLVGPEGAAEVAFEAGKARLAGCLVMNADAPDWSDVYTHLESSVRWGRGGKVAICLAGGGLEGLFYQLGALKALQRFLPEHSVADVDIICGISAGAVLGGFLANGVGPEEMIRGLRTGGPRVHAIRRADLFDPNLGEVAERAGYLALEVLRGARSPVSAAFRLPPAGFFAGKRLSAWLQRQFESPGMINDFDQLPRKFFVGATDMDTSDHVLFGASDAPRVPVHRAIRASTALVPFYAPERIDGRYYMDGGFTRTTNMRVAVQEGATLVILVDPLVPVFSLRPGHVAQRGAVYAMMQGLKQLIHGRFDKAVPTLRAMYPHVAFHLFQPGDATRRVMAGSPMKYFYREEIVDMAYRETMRDIRLHRLGPLGRDFARHGYSFIDPDFAENRVRTLPDEPTSEVVA